MNDRTPTKRHGRRLPPDPYTYVGVCESLPTATAAFRHQLRILRGGAGVGDILYICQKNSGDTYDWEQLTDDLTITTLTVDGNSFLGNADSDETAIRGHLIFEGAAPTVAFGPAAGAGPVLNGVAGTDGGFRVVFTTGTAPATGLLFTVTFADAWSNSEYHVSAMGYDGDGATMVKGGCFVDHANKTAAAFPFHIQTAPPASTSHFLDFIVLGGT